MTDLANLNVLVTGACGVTSRAVVRSLKRSPSFNKARIVGTDICQNLYGIAEGLYDVLYHSPHVTDDSYADAINWVCAHESIDAAIIAPELEVMHWAHHTINAPCLLPPGAFCQTAGSKVSLYLALEQSGTVPRFEVVSRQKLLAPGYQPVPGWPCWIRDHQVGSTSGRGSLLANDLDDLHAWITLNPAIQSFMIAEFLPGRNFACHLLYYDGKVIKTGMYERLAYFMGRIAPSGISGNISQGRLLNDAAVLDTATQAVEAICAQTNERMQGLVAVDLRQDAAGKPMITEVNLRHVACTYAFACAGNNLAEAQLFATLDMPDRVGPRDHCYPPGNYILRDIDGPALWVPELIQPSAISRIPTSP